MMISPEGYYELYLKDRSSQEILKEIKSLKREINQLKREIEDPAKETRYGTKQFRPGAKVYMAPSQWGDGYDRIVAIGKPRRSKEYIEVIMRSEYTENYRIQKVFTPFLLKMMELSEHYWWNASEESRQDILRIVEFMAKRKAESTPRCEC